MERVELANTASERAVISLEVSDEESLFAEALTTRGIVCCKLGRAKEARALFEGAWRIAERCGDSEGAGRALLTLVEQLVEHFDAAECQDIAIRIRQLLGKTQAASTRSRVEKCLRLLSPSLLL